MSLPSADPIPRTARPRNGLRTIAEALGCGIAAGVCTGVAWIAGHALASICFRIPLFTTAGNWLSDGTIPILAVIGATSGLIVGSVASAFGARRSWAAASIWVAVCVPSGTVAGALMPFTVKAFPSLPIELSSAIAWNTVGFLVGLGGFVWSQWTAEAKAEEPDEDEAAEDEADEEEGQPPGKGKAWLPPKPQPQMKPKATRRPILRFVPAVGVSLFALAAAALTAPSSARWALAVGLLGLSIIPILWKQERRLTALERRFQGDRDA